MTLKITGAREFLKLVGEKTDRDKTSLYISKSVYKRFSDACDSERASKSTVIEALMDAFVKASKKK